jgi:hypothetical protein
MPLFRSDALERPHCAENFLGNLFPFSLSTCALLLWCCNMFEMEASMSGANNPLARELAFYEVHKSEWLPLHENQFVVVAGDDVAGFYKDYESAWDAGTRKFGVQAKFFIKQICQYEPVYSLY